MKKRGILVALTNPIEGREAEYNDWYDNVHVPDLLKIPGVVGARRFRVLPRQHRSAPIPWQYCATYELEVDDFAAVADELERLRGPTGKGTADMAISPALADERLAWFFEEILACKN
ncbi:MAG TPA: hypothetical protein VGB91_08490 [Rhizomicrobium sp.]